MNAGFSHQTYPRGRSGLPSCPQVAPAGLAEQPTAHTDIISQDCCAVEDGHGVLLLIVVELFMNHPGPSHSSTGTCTPPRSPERPSPAPCPRSPPGLARTLLAWQSSACLSACLWRGHMSKWKAMAWGGASGWSLGEAGQDWAGRAPKVSVLVSHSGRGCTVHLPLKTLGCCHTSCFSGSFPLTGDSLSAALLCQLYASQHYRIRGLSCGPWAVSTGNLAPQKSRDFHLTT